MSLLPTRRPRRTHRTGVHLWPTIDIRLTPVSTDGGAWTAHLLTKRAKDVFRADEIVVVGELAHALVRAAAQAHLLVD